MSTEYNTAFQAYNWNGTEWAAFGPPTALAFTGDEISTGVFEFEINQIYEYTGSDPWNNQDFRFVGQVTFNGLPPSGDPAILAVFTSETITVDASGQLQNVQVDNVLFVVSPIDTSGVTPPETFPGTYSALDPSNLIYCFLEGTLIATPEGERRVETLAMGDPVLTADGRAIPVKWMGRQTIHRHRVPEERLAAVTIRAGALGPNEPHTDLTVTADHGMIVDGLVVNAAALVNGTSVVWTAAADLPETVIYWHVETENHDVIVANGAPAETFIDHASRRGFDNYAEYEALFGPVPPALVELARPRVMSRRQLPARLRARLAERAADLAGLAGTRSAV